MKMQHTGSSHVAVIDNSSNKGLLCCLSVLTNSQDFREQNNIHSYAHVFELNNVYAFNIIRIALQFYIDI